VAGKQPGGRVLRDENFLCGKESVYSQTHNKRNLTLFISVATYSVRRKVTEFLNLWPYHYQNILTLTTRTTQEDLYLNTVES
jgi:hypothetical protein